LSVAIGIGLSVTAAWLVQRDIHDSAQREFEFAASEIRQNIQARLRANEQALYAGVGLFSTLDTVTRSDWQSFTRNLRVQEYLPGTQGIGFTASLAPEEVDPHIRAMRADGFPDYSVRPPGRRERTSAILYLEPQSGRNLRAFGFDMYSEPVRRQAMDLSMDRNVPALSGIVTLVQETKEDVQTGCLLYMPVYHRGQPASTVEERRRALRGWVYSPYRMNDLMQGTLRGWDLRQREHPLVVEIYDGDSVHPGSLLYRSRLRTDSIVDTAVNLVHLDSLEASNRRWTLRVLQLGTGMTEREHRTAWVVLAGGSAISFLLLGLIWALSNTRVRSREMADRSTRELRQMTERLSLATRTGGVGIWDYDISTGRLVWDDQMFKLYGIAPDSFVAAYDTWRNGVHPDDRERADAEIQMAIRGEKEFDTEFRVVWPDGSVHHIRAISFLDRDGNGAPLRLVGTNWDITREKESEEALRQSEKKISQLLQTTDQGIYGIDAEGNCTFVNRSGLQMLGYSLEECLGRNMHRLIHHSHPDGSPYLWQTCPIFRSGLDGGGCRLDTEVFWRKDGSSIPVEYSSHPVVVDGTIEGSVVTFSDITARKEAESALLASNDELQEATMRANEMAVRAEMANAAKGEFLANMSHEIRTPMNGVLGLTGLLLDTDLDKDQRRFAETIRQSAESLLSLINDILDFSKIEAGKLELERLDFDLREMVSDLSSSLSPRVQDKGLELRHRIDPEVPDRLLGDSGRLRQILLNLLSNAIKFTHRGSITLEAKLDEESAGDVLLRFAVRDTGIGIPQDKQALLFQKFSQVDASTTRQFGGTGLGLAISKQLAELMGGQIGVISREGVGTEFWFTVRMARSTAAPPADKPLEIPVDLGELRHRSVRILLAEDNITNQMVAMGILERLGLRVDVVANGEEAVHALEQFPYDLVLMDVQMPEMDGLTATRRIRDRHSPVLDHNIPVIAMTANAMQGDRERCLAAGMDDYVPKPVSPQALAAALDKWLPRSGDPKTDSVMPAASPPPAIPRATVVFDWPGLVERMLGQESLAQKILRSSMTQIPGQASILLERMETGNLPEIKRLAHALKGAVANLGGEEIRLEMESLERQAGEADIASIQGNVERLGKRFAALFAQMEAHLRP